MKLAIIELVPCVLCPCQINELKLWLLLLSCVHVLNLRSYIYAVLLYSFAVTQYLISLHLKLWHIRQSSLYLSDSRNDLPPEFSCRTNHFDLLYRAFLSLPYIHSNRPSFPLHVLTYFHIVVTHFYVISSSLQLTASIIFLHPHLISPDT